MHSLVLQSRLGLLKDLQGSISRAFAAVRACFGGVCSEFPGVYTHLARQQKRKPLGRSSLHL